ncbi:hypothetical protein JOD54_004155 [Actinokineospora baliensis]|uniref:hypothetical protein n=1 Tax=Actinokineospora baliensis TaxID=547056 RepID=UPI00195A48AC|nr:hypothetical protein [Actinokineospora baliensis]MBM7773951.1 hypothetical protein [Actinokineospora baliensis]
MTTAANSANPLTRLDRDVAVTQPTRSADVRLAYSAAVWVLPTPPIPDSTTPPETNPANSGTDRGWNPSTTTGTFPDR